MTDGVGPMPAEAHAMHGLRVRAPDQEIRFDSMAVPTPGIGDVLIEVAAASFTPTELEWPSTWVDRGGRDRTPIVPSHEVSGTVTALGYGTTGLSVGDEVYGLTDWYRDGAAADYVATEARNLAPKPRSVSHTDAASLPLAGLTAWQALLVHGALQPGQSVVISGAGGGVGALAVQVARDAGARVVAVAHQWARGFLSDLGVDTFVDADGPEGGVINGADLYLDLVGGELAARCSAMVRRGGRVISVVGPEVVTPPGIGFLFFVVEPDRPQLVELAERVDAGRIRPVVSRVVDMAMGGEQGFAAKQGGGLPGKIVLERHRP